MVFCGITINWRGERRSASVSKIHARLSPEQGNAAAGRYSEIEWLNAFS